MNSTSNRDLRAKRARYCYDDVASWQGSWRKEATQRAKGLPVEIRSQGLMVTVATLMSESKSREGSGRLVDLLATWLLRDADHRPLRAQDVTGGTPAHRLLDACAKASRAEYASTEREAITFLNQVKIYADALVSERSNDRT